jgi:periplasmic divalent cation tolerance protein
MAESRTRIVLSHFENEENALEMGRRLVDERLAACVNVEGPTTSIYRWEGERVEEEEWSLVAKSRREREDDVIAFIEDHHPYDCPEVLVVDVDHASAEYEDWVQEQVR